MVEAALREYKPYEVQEEILRGLEPGTENLDGLVQDFLQIWQQQPQKTKILCFYEQRASPIGNIVGGEKRIVSYISFTFRIGVDYQHRILL